MLHIFKCRTCGTEIECYCFEHLNYTDEGNKTRERQLDAMQCISCFGETPELKEKQTPVPCFDMRTGDINLKTSKDENV